MKKGGAAKGELILAMYELANSFRHGWGVEKDPVAARSYYETAANLGDTDAMNEVARCYEEGFGGKKDRVSGSTFSTGARMNGEGSIGRFGHEKASYIFQRGVCFLAEAFREESTRSRFSRRTVSFWAATRDCIADRRMII